MHPHPAASEATESGSPPTNDARKRLRIGLIREGKVPHDARVALTPDQCATLIQNSYDKEIEIEILVQPSQVRCYPDAEYAAAGILLTENLDDCDLLLGIKEVPIADLHDSKTYLFFSHTIKEQPYNRKLLRAILEKNIRLIDWETLTDDSENRLIAFGRWAGIVGAHNGMTTLARRTGAFELPQMIDFHDYATAKAYYLSHSNLNLPPVKIVLTGTGRVANGAAEVLDAMHIQRVSAADFITQTYPHAVYTQLSAEDYVQHREGKPYDRYDFHHHPENYVGTFEPYTRVADVFINGIYWHTGAPVFFTADEMCHPAFRIRVIADVTCDIAPDASVPSTLKASTIAEPIFGYNIHTKAEDTPHQPDVVDVMSIDNLPNELPRDASEAFGEQFIEAVLPELIKSAAGEESRIIARATIARDGVLTTGYEYLRAYAGV